MCIEHTRTLHQQINGNRTAVNEIRLNQTRIKWKSMMMHQTAKHEFKRKIRNQRVFCSSLLLGSVLSCCVLLAGFVRRFKQCVVLLQLQLNEFKRYYGLLIWRKRVYRVCVKNKAYALALIYIARKNTTHIESETECKSTDQNEKRNENISLLQKNDSVFFRFVRQKMKIT